MLAALRHYPASINLLLSCMLAAFIVAGGCFICWERPVPDVTINPPARGEVLR
jgi:hypothetical protein